MSDASWRVFWATVIGIGLALLAAAVWRSVRRPVKHLFERQAWDALFSRPSYVQVWLKDGTIILGAPRVFSESAETDSQDLYLDHLAWVDPESGDRTAMEYVEALWIAAGEIRFIQLLEDVAPVSPPGVAPDERGNLHVGKSST